jgi:putative nucleotidyltransferase with HDIG domain
MPHSLAALDELLERTPVDLKSLGLVVRNDPALVLRVLRLSQAAASEGEPSPASIEECLILLGLDCLRAQLLRVPVLGTGASAAASSGLGAFRQHSCLTAIFSQRVAEWCSSPDGERAYLAGMLHDIGKVPQLLFRTQVRCSQPATWICDPCRAGGMRNFGMDHCAVGAWLATIWRLPGFLVDVIEHHHNVQDARIEPTLVAIVAAADILCHALVVTPEEACAPPSQNLYSRLNQLLPTVGNARIKGLLDVAQADYQQWLRSFGEQGLSIPNRAQALAAANQAEVKL